MDILQLRSFHTGELHSDQIDIRYGNQVRLELIPQCRQIVVFLH